MAIWTRQKTATASSATSITVAFDESTALPVSSSLFAILMTSGGASEVVSTSWSSATPLTGSGSNGSTGYLAGFFVSGDESKNSITVTFSTAQTYVKIILLSFDGYVSSAYQNGALNSASQTSTAVGPITTNATNTISIAAIGLNAGSSGGWVSDWTNNFVNASNDIASDRISVGVYASTQNGTSVSTQRSWTASRSVRAVMWSFQGVSSEAVTTPVQPSSNTVVETTDVASFCVGADSVDRIYAGTTLVYGSNPVTPGVTKFGPNGTHYPTNAPDVRNPGNALIIPVSANWAEIRAELEALSDEDIDNGVIIAVAPGTFTSNGAGNGSTTELSGYENTRTKRVVIASRDGFGTVFSGRHGSGNRGLLVSNVRGVVLLGMNFHKLEVSDVINFSAAWSEVKGEEGYAGYLGLNSTNASTTNSSLVEVVVSKDVFPWNADVAQMQNSGTSLSNILIEGCYFGPRYYLDGDYNHPNESGHADGDVPHTDTLQIDGTTSNFTFKDSAFFTSNNAGLIFGNTTNLLLDQVFVLGDDGLQASRYPYPAGAAGHPDSIEDDGPTKVMMGTIANATAINSIIVGAIPGSWTSVSNTRQAQSIPTPASGAWTPDAKSQQWTDAEIIAAGCPKPSDSSMAAMWAYPKLV